MSNNRGIYGGVPFGAIQTNFYDQQETSADGRLAYASDIDLCDAISVGEEGGVGVGYGVKSSLCPVRQNARELTTSRLFCRIVLQPLLILAVWLSAQWLAIPALTAKTICAKNQWQPSCVKKESAGVFMFVWLTLLRLELPLIGVLPNACRIAMLK